MQQSAEIAALYRQLSEAFSNGDVSFFERYISKKEGVIVIGTDPGEWLAGYTTFIEWLKAAFLEFSGSTMRAEAPLAYRENSVGWLTDQTKWVLPDGTEIPLRVTAVFRMEADDWKIVQWHASVAIPNEEVAG